MKQLLFYCLTLISFAGCKKENAGSRIDIYLLKSFSYSVDRSTSPATVSIVNALLEDTAIVGDNDILFYTKATTTFKLKKDIQAIIRNFEPNKGFSVSVDNQPIYYGIFHPGYLSSIAFGIATIDPFINTNNELKIDFATIDGEGFLNQFDKRNDIRIIGVLKATNRLK